jgi:hypothetical protein
MNLVGDGVSAIAADEQVVWVEVIQDRSARRGPAGCARRDVGESGSPSSGYLPDGRQCLG